MRPTSTKLIQRLRPEHPQLAVLVGLLVVSFGLTVGLAWQAWDAGRGEAAGSNRLLVWTLRQAAREWAVATDEGVAGSLIPTFARLYLPLLERPDTLDSAAIGAALDSTAVPPRFVPHLRATAFFLDFAEAEPGSAPVAWLAGVAADTTVPIGRGLYAGIHVDVPDPENGALAYVARVVEGRPSHLVGYRLPPAFLDEVLATGLAHARSASGNLPLDVDPHALYALSALRTSDGVPIVADSTPVVADLRVPVRAGQVLRGVEFSVGLKPAGARYMEYEPVTSARLPALLALLFSVAVVFAAALFVMRREAELSWMRARFVSGVSHELRTPLAQIRLFAETLILGRYRTEADRRRSLEIIDQEARRLSHLVENILLFSRAERGAVRVAPEAARIAQEVGAAVADFQALPRARDAAFRLELQEDVVVPVDVGALRQIVNNLLDNALKYGPAGQRVTVGLALFGPAARLWVDDEGPGIPAGQRAQVFDSFYRLRRDEESRIAGSGIGLAVVRELAALHGGKAWAEEAPGGGARLLVSFPHAELAPAAAVPAAQAAAVA